MAKSSISAAASSGGGALDDERLTQADLNAIKTQGTTDLNASNAMYDDMINANNAMKDQTLDMIDANQASREEIANANTEFAIDKIEQQKDQATKDYTKEQSGAYQDWQKQSNPYGANAERMAANGLTNTGYSESSQVAMYVAYQNRVAVARESYQRAMLDYDNAITEARLQNNSLLAEIAAQALEQRMEAIVTFTQQGNTLLMSKADAAYKIKQTTHANYMDVLKQIEQQRQFDESMAEQIRQHNEEMAYKNASLAEQKRQFDTTLAWQKEQAANKSSGGSGGSSGGSSGGGSKIDKDSGSSGGGKIEASTPTFTGSTYDEAVEFMKKNGVDNAKASGVMTQSEWTRRKNSGSNSGHVNYSSYAAYLKDYVSYAIESK